MREYLATDITISQLATFADLYQRLVKSGYLYSDDSFWNIRSPLRGELILPKFA